MSQILCAERTDGLWLFWHDDPRVVSPVEYNTTDGQRPTDEEVLALIERLANPPAEGGD